MSRGIACVLLLLELTFSVPGVTQNQSQATPTPTPTPNPTPSPEYKKEAGSLTKAPSQLFFQMETNHTETKSAMRGDVEILSDTKGVDFGPYLQRALSRVKTNWYNRIPEVAKPPIRKGGRLIIQFAILKDGSVAGMVLQQPSGDVYLDRAAWGGITASDPFERLPAEFLGAYLALRVKFLYNTQSGSASTEDVVPPEDRIRSPK